MGLIKAAFGAMNSTFADQWKEFFYCEALPADVLVRRGEKQIGKRSSNKKGNDNVISNGSGIAVADGQCMIIVEQGKVVELCAEPGEYTYDTSTEPSVFTGKFGKGLKDMFKTMGKRFTYGGDAGKDQRVYYFNTKEIMGNRFGTPSPIMFDVVNKQIGMRRTVQVRCNGVYSYTISNPMQFYTKVCGNVSYQFTRDEIDAQLKTEFISALQPALAALSELELRPAQIPAKANELKAAMNEALKMEWEESRGISVEKIALNPITLSPEDMKKINQMEDAITMGTNPFMMAGRMADASATAMENAASNPGGAMNGFVGMGMAMNMGGMNSAQSFYNTGVAQQQQMQQQQQPAADSWKCACGNTATGKFCPECGAKKPEPKVAESWKCACGNTATGKFCPECGAKKPEADGWTCACGAVNKGKFCAECGAKKPAGVPQYKCDKCGWEPEKGVKAPKFCPECGDPFDDGDIV
ncbi:MAG: SPFH domain-containing protein [Ruminococcaceae bacterium]|nr:SPFH domain-containing protein [Oscillospiraceae bacterium]